MNTMRNLKIAAVTVNMGIGEGGKRLAIAEKLLEQLTGQKPIRRMATKAIQPFGIRKGLPIACKVTLRNEKAIDFLKRALEAKDRRIKSSNFDQLGNFSFGIREHIDIDGVKYDPNVGIVGMDVNISIERSGSRVKKRALKRTKIGKRHLVSKDDAIEFIKEEFNVVVED